MVFLSSRNRKAKVGPGKKLVEKLKDYSDMIHIGKTISENPDENILG